MKATAEITGGHRELVSALFEAESCEKNPFGLVIGVHQKVINIRRRESHRIVSLLTAASGKEPWALTTSARSFSEIGITLGAPLWLDEKNLKIGTDGNGGNVIFSVRSASLRQYDVEEASFKVSDRKVYETNILQMKAVVERFAAYKENCYDHGCREKLRGLCAQMTEAARRKNRQEVLETAKKLVGLGPGLTPSGDDWLVGFWAASFVETHPLCSWKDLWERIGCDAEGRTTELSWEFLKRAGQGVFSWNVRQLLKAVCQSSDVKEAAEAVLSTGSTSGVDTAEGLLTGLLLNLEENKSEVENRCIWEAP